MSGGEPPLPPSRPPYQSWPGRPPHRRRGGGPGSRSGWVGRRPRSPPPPLPFRPRHSRGGPYKHHRHLPHTPPSSSQSQHHSGGYHPHGPPPPLSRSMQSRLRSPPRSPIRRPDLGPHRMDQPPYRGEPGPPHRVDPIEHPPYRSSDHVPLRPPLPKLRGEPPPYRSDHIPHRGPVEHHAPYRGEPGPLYRADLGSHRDDYEPRRNSDGMGSRGEISSQHGSWFRHSSKIHKPLKPKKRRLPPHIVGPMRSSAPYISKPESPILSRMGMPFGERNPNSYRMDGMAPISPRLERGPHGYGGYTKDIPEGFCHAPKAQSPESPTRLGNGKRPENVQRLQRSADLPYPFERYGGGIPNGVVSGGFREHRGAGMNARYGAIPLTGKAEGESPGVVNKPSRDETCNGDAGPVENGYLGERKSRSASPSQRKKSVISDTASAETTDEKTAEDGNRTEKDKLKSIPSESESSVKTRIACKNASERNSANEEKVEKAEKCEDLQSEIEGARAAAKSDADMYSPDKKLTDGKNDERSGPEKLLKIPSLSPHDIAIAKADPSPRTPLSLRSVPLPSLGLVRKPSPVLHSKAPEDASVLEVVKTGTAPCQKEENQSSPDIAGNDLAPVDVPLPALSYLRSSPRGRLRTFEAEKNIVSFSDFLRQKESRQPVSPSKSASRDKVGVASNELVSEIHKVEGLITQKEKDLSSARSQLRETEKSNESIDKASSVVQKKAPSAQDEYATMATRIANAPRRREAKKRPRSGMQPMDSVLRLIVTQNQCRAHAAAAVFRTLCWDTERGLDPAMSPIERMTVPELSGNTTAKMKEKILGIRQAQIDRRRKVRKDYIELRDSWRRNLKAARDMRSKEKIDAVRERDRFLLLSTKGHSALLTSRTSSGRTSTKVIPSLSANGQMNGTAELDSQLAEIEAKGGTPGSRAIWSKTLADIPAQDISRLPTDCFSVLMDDPLAEHHAARSVNPWQFEEKLVFLEKYITYSKNFRKIASFLEHKSSRDCSYFYYSNKLDLGLKQLAKDAASMKRKGLLRAFLFDLAKKRSHCYSRDPQSGPCTPAIRNAISAVPNASNIFDRHFIGTGRVVMGGHRRPDSAPLKRSERILRENGCLDLSGIDRRAFGSAIARYGTNWALVASHLSIPRKSSSHFREYYRKNRRRFEADETNGKSRTNGGGRGPNSKHSPRMSPKSSPKSSSSRGKRSEAALKDGIPDIVLVEGVRPSSAKRPRKGDERCPDERALLEDFRTATKSESDGKKLRPTATWTVEEGAQFRALFKQYGRDWKAIAELMRPKTPTQVKGYWRKVSREVGDGVSVANAKSSKSEKRQADSENSNEMGAECARPGKIQGQSKNAGGSSSAISELGKAGEKKAKGEGSNNSDEVMMAVETCSKAVSRTEVIEDRMEIKDDGEVWKVKKGEGGLVEQRIGRASPPPSASSKLPMLRSFRPPFLRSAPAPVDRKEKIYPPVPNGGMSRSTQNANGDKGRPDGCDSSLLQNDLEKAAESYGVLELLESRLRKAEEEHMRKKE